MEIGIYIEFISLILGIVGLIYIFGVMKLVDHNMYKGWNLILLAYIFFILAKLSRVLEYADVIDFRGYNGILGVLFIIFATMGIIYFNKETLRVLERRRKRK